MLTRARRAEGTQIYFTKLQTKEVDNRSQSGMALTLLEHLQQSYVHTPPIPHVSTRRMVNECTGVVGQSPVPAHPGIFA